MCNWLKFIPAALLALCACSGSDYTPVPRQHAYPRIALNKPTYALADSVPLVNFSVNSNAVLVLKNNGCDIVYNNLNATVYISVISNLNDPQIFSQTWDNRIDRINRNLAGTQFFSSQLNNSAFNGVILLAQSVSQTPVQLLAANTQKGIIVSATAFMHSDIHSNAFDSIAPVYKAIFTDITKLGQTLSCK